MHRATKKTRRLMAERQDRQPEPQQPLDFTPIRAAMRARLLRMTRNMIADLQDMGLTLSDIAPRMGLRDGALGHVVGSRGSLPDAVSLGLLNVFGQSKGLMHLALLSPSYAAVPVPPGRPGDDLIEWLRSLLASI